jgi:hypothetical protein
MLFKNVATVLSKASGLRTGRTKVQPTNSRLTESQACEEDVLRIKLLKAGSLISTQCLP